MDGDLFISMHCNSWFSEETGGFEAYFLSPAKTEYDRAVAAAENAADEIAEERSEAVEDIDFILWDIVQNEFINESSHFAEFVQKAMSDRLGIRNRGVKQARFTVLQGARMPAVLVETAFLSNPGEEKLLVERELPGQGGRGDRRGGAEISRAFRDALSARERASHDGYDYDKRHRRARTRRGGRSRRLVGRLSSPPLRRSSPSSRSPSARLFYVWHRSTRVEPVPEEPEGVDRRSRGEPHGHAFLRREGVGSALPRDAARRRREGFRRTGPAGHAGASRRAARRRGEHDRGGDASSERVLRFGNGGAVSRFLAASSSPAIPAGASAEYYTIAAIVRTVSENFPEVRAVQILVEGLQVGTIAGHIDAYNPFLVRDWR